MYFLPLFGGLLADRVLGFSRAILIGGVLMMCGHLVLGVERLPFFYAGLVLLCAGSGLLKPNISTLVGNLYRDRPACAIPPSTSSTWASTSAACWRRSARPGCAHYGWSVAFMSAAVAMAISLLIFALFKGYVADASQRVEASSPEAQELSGKKPARG